MTIIHIFNKVLKNTEYMVKLKAAGQKHSLHLSKTKKSLHDSEQLQEKKVKWSQILMASSHMSFTILGSKLNNNIWA